ncbi:hypothetical protein FHL15_008847 [Xylaria flabelliformis]|uniref:Uncharacterized protein n=1 Tax=Xylaria flabelliformis TaxID=2512241 RepID=A0A553HQR5_9PEZI|nr:hypothetical protein FHL15_008847 [Xylaria flabelliformis]
MSKTPLGNQEPQFALNAPHGLPPNYRDFYESRNASDSSSLPNPTAQGRHHVSTAVPAEQREQQVHISSDTHEEPPLLLTSSRWTTLETLRDDTSQDAGGESRSKASRLPIKDSLGLSGQLNIIGGSVLILGLLSFLLFLWFGHGTREAADATWAWRQIALKGYMVQAVTLASLVLRLAVSMQSVVCTSMLAALVLEKRFARKSDVAWFSVMRSTNDGPLKMAQMMLFSKYLTRHIEFWLLSLLALVTLALQFSSTILLSDITNFVILGDVGRVSLPDLLNINEQDFDIDIPIGSFITQKPIYGIIGEANTSFNTSPDVRGLSQTGLVQRAFLPLSETENRTSIRHFNGNAMVMSSNVACIRPEMSDVSLSLQGRLDGASDAYIEGSLQYGLSIDNAQATANQSCISGDCDETGFSCQLPATTFDNVDYWQSVACYVDVVGGQINLSALEARWNSTEQPWSKDTPITLVFSTNIEDWGQINVSEPFSSSLENGEWRSYEVTPSHFLNISLCFPAVTLDRKSVTMEASWSLQEPTTQWSLTSNNHSTLDVQRYMGSDSPRGSLADRGILDMQILGDPNDGPPTSPANQPRTVISIGMQANETSARLTPRLEEWTQYSELTAVGTSNTTWILCLYCNAGGIGPHAETALLFSDIISRTSRAADALLSFHTAEALLVHYSYLSSYTLPYDAQVASTTSVRAPSKCSETGCGGLVTVLVLVGVHLLYVAVIATIYTTQIRHSRYANIWHAVSQLTSSETRETLDAANNDSDEGVFKDKEKYDKDDFVKLVRLENGKIEIVKHHLETKTWGPSWVTKIGKKMLTMKWSKKNESRKQFQKSRFT